MRLVDDRSGLEALSQAECLQLLADVPVGRIVVVVGGRPHVVPVNYVLEDDAIVFRTDPGTTLAAVDGAAVAFEVDQFDIPNRIGWSVVVHGIAEVVSPLDGPANARAGEVDTSSWAGDKGHVVIVRPTMITGRRIGPRH